MSERHFTVVAGRGRASFTLSALCLPSVVVRFYLTFYTRALYSRCCGKRIPYYTPSCFIGQLEDAARRRYVTGINIVLLSLRGVVERVNEQNCRRARIQPSCARGQSVL